MNFKEFVKANVIWDDYSDLDDYRTASLSIEDIGKWSFEKWLEKKDTDKNIANIYLEIAEVCLGKKIETEAKK